jgi:molybdopterin-containing oxidoreductase family membrane subunit
MADQSSALRERDARINADILRTITETGWRYRVTMAVLGLIILNAVVAFGYQVVTGMGVAGIRRPVFWGLYIASFVFWIGMSHSGTMISAILRLTHANWRLPITRGAEAMTLISLMVAGLFPIIHLGRSWLFYWLIPLPNQRGLWPNFRSPLLWDATAIFAYVTGSTIFLYVALVPDLGFLRNKFQGWRRRLYGLLSLGWQGTDREWRWLERAMLIMAVLIIPVAVSVHSIVSWDFGMTLVPGWHTTIFAPYFVLGAIYSGTAAVITILALLRWAFRFESYLTRYHFNQLAKLLLALTLLWFYFNFAEFLTVWYGNQPMERLVFFSRFRPPFGSLFYTMLLFGFVVPVIYLSVPKLRRWLPGLFVVSLLINVAMYIERVLIILPSLAYSRFPFSWEQYTPSWVEISIVAGSFALFAMMYMGFLKLFPVISLWEYKHGLLYRSSRRLAGKLFPSYLAPHVSDGREEAIAQEEAVEAQ